MRRLWIGILILCVGLAGVLVLWLGWEFANPYYGASTPETFVDIPHGAGIRTIAAVLKSGGTLRRELPFILYVRWKGLGKQLKAGEYRFTTPARPAEIVRRLVAGDVYFHTLTIPEGTTANEIVDLMARSGLGSESDLEELCHRTDWISDLSPNAPSLEGFLFPDTYRYSRHSSAEQLVKEMVLQFRSHLKSILSENRLPPGWTLPQIVTLASMIEKEAKSDEERRLVASVLANRLRLKMPLACDPTIIYALKQSGRYHGNLHKTDLALDSPYNTYINAGLPPGPIANPGSESLKAALSPATSDYLYYVSKNDGTHAFSRDFRAHLLAVERYQKRR
jgi:UPF0755 protein